jgi:hypothetical protein
MPSGESPSREIGFPASKLGEWRQAEPAVFDDDF